jgi:serine/threonine-protein kinase ATR
VSDTLRTHVKGVLTRNPNWGPPLVEFQVECAWMVSAWSDVRNLVDSTDTQTPSVVMARLLLAMRTGDPPSIANAASTARSVLVAPIMASGARGYRRSYDAVLNLHLTHELDFIHKTMSCLPPGSQGGVRRERLVELSQTLAQRLDVTIPTFRAREPVLSMRRTAFALTLAVICLFYVLPSDCAHSTSIPRHILNKEIARAWLASAKIARKAGQWQTAYCSMLQAQEIDRRYSFMEGAKIIKATGEPLRALQELENSMQLLGLIEDTSDVIDLTDDDDEAKRTKAKVGPEIYR